MISTNSVLETSMYCTRINIIRKSKLLDPSKPLKPGMLNQLENQGTLNTYKAVNRVVKYLESIQIIPFSVIKGIAFSMYI